MPDTEAAAPEAGAPTSVTEATPAPEAKTGPARGKMTEGQRIAAAAAELSKIEKKPFDPAKDAPATETDAAPEGEVEETAAEEKQPERKVTSAEWRTFLARKDKLEKREQAFAARESRVADVEKQLAAWEADKKLLREDPKAYWAKVAAEHGSDFSTEYSKFADAYLNEGKPDAKLDALQRHVEELKAKLTEKEETEKKSAEERQAREVFGAFLRVATSDEHKATSYTFRKYGEQTVLTDAAAMTRSLAQKHQRMPSDAEIARELDIQYQAYYKEIVDSQSGLSQPPTGDAGQVNGAVKSANTAAPKAPKTLTNGGAAERAAPSRKMTERERIEAAIKLLPG